MEYEEFKQWLNQKNITVIQKETMRVRGFTVDAYRALAKETERVDYDCDFRDGTCRSMRSEERVCCVNCAETIGYWCKEGGHLDEDTARRIAGSYERGSGFCNVNTGCVLPRELRSPTCLYMYCSNAKMSGEDLALLGRIRSGAYWS